jgi:hypothetical protein
MAPKRISLITLLISLTYPFLNRRFIKTLIGMIISSRYMVGKKGKSLGEWNAEIMAALMEF